MLWHSELHSSDFRVVEKRCGRQKMQDVPHKRWTHFLHFRLEMKGNPFKTLD